MIVSNLELNMEVLNQRFKHVAQKMLVIESDDIKDKKFVQEPWDKDENWLEAVRGSVEDLNIIFVYGFGQGLGIADLLEMYPNRWLFVYEPDEQAFLNSMKEYDFRELLNHPNLQWVSVGETQLNMLFYLVCSYMNQEMAFVALRHYLDNDMDVLREVKEDFKEYNITFNSNKLTQQFFQEDWLRNGLYQMASMLFTPALEELQGQFKGGTAVVISSGPSLQEDIEWITRLKPHALIIAAGSSIQALVKNGIRPHLTVVMDGGVINNKVFEDPRTLESPLLHTSSAYYEISERKSNHLIHSIMKNDVASQYFMGLPEEEVIISSTPTVAGTAMQAAIRLGATRIIMMGQDLSFPGNKYYADGVNHVSTERANSDVETAKIQVLNVNGTYNTTNQSFMFMKDSLEDLVTAFTDIEFINSTRNGASIEGTVWMPIEEIYDLIKNEQMDQECMVTMSDKTNYVTDMQKVTSVTNKIKATMADFEVMKSEIKDIQKLLGKVQELSRTKPVKGQRMMESIEIAWGKLVHREWFDPILETVLPTSIKVFDQQLPIIVNEKNLVLKSDLIYKHLGKVLKDIIEKIPSLIELFTESIRRIDEINMQRVGANGTTDVS
ncbi:motility associated factor glycosyltransferase family protein [Paenibacillus nuruki]|uniref:motility associated factor glycosyltransferase family protein n=1 Tax=Paenibacillus nuruki TaxID=1886670 RepID=UPI002804C21B|nr:6-hydroxymethylpterin diphosphokinase MptE-like protein [Paenibacillus nuruki]CAJ1317869.1 MptE-like domain-containing protein [Paenibacillus nuruki]